MSSIGICIALIMGTVIYIQIQKLIPVGADSDDLVGEHYEDVLHELQTAGFTNIDLLEKDILRIDEVELENLVTRVQIGVDTSFEDTNKYPYDTYVVITYRTVEEYYPPMTSKEARGQHYEDVYDAFEDAGFVNVQYEIKYDIITGWITSDGEVDKITIDGEKDFDTSEDYRPDVKIIITYHTYAKNKPDK